jgi:probable phosphoglycerate mutase
MLLGRTVDAPLDAHGLLQAHALGRRLADRRKSLRLETSPRLRTRQTAEAISQHTKCCVVVEPAFDEVDFGRWSGQSFASLNLDPGWLSWNAQRSRCSTPAGESVARIQERVTRRLMELSVTSPDCTVGVVTHAEIIRSMLLRWLQIPVDAFHQVEVHPASITTIEFSPRRVRILDREEPAAA